jgi:hypothetical protein
MINVNAKRCEVEGCEKVANYNQKGLKMPKLDIMMTGYTGNNEIKAMAERSIKSLSCLFKSGSVIF